MGDKFDNKKKSNNKKMTTKEKKAQNHLKLMQGQKDRHDTGSNIVASDQHKDKKAA